MFVAEIAPQVDRLVWTVNYAAADLHTADDAFRTAGIEEIEFGRIANYVPAFRGGPVAEATLYRRYRYNPPLVVATIIEKLSHAECIELAPEGYLATDRFASVLDAISDALVVAAEETWSGNETTVDALSGLVRRVLDTAPGSPLLDAYRNAPEPDPAMARLHQRLAIQRLIRNEAHAAAWQSHGLRSEDMVILTGLWNGDITGATAWTGPATVVADGRLTEAGQTLRHEIETATNRNNEPAFGALTDADRATYLAAVSSLPGTPV